MNFLKRILLFFLWTSISCKAGTFLDNFKDNQAKAVFKQMQERNTDILKLENLQINNAQIVYLDGFEQLTNLKNLSLAGNLIKNIGPISKLDKIECQDLSDNQILYANCLFVLKNLEVLNLSYNCLKYAFCCSFESMRTLNLSHNEIQQVIFSDKCDLLESIDLSFNPITQIAIRVDLPSLKNFFADHTLLKDLKPFLKLSTLEVLSVANCIHIKTIEDLFQKTSLGFECVLPHLKALNISEEFLNDASKQLLEKVKAGELKRPFTLNKVSINHSANQCTSNSRKTI